MSSLDANLHDLREDLRVNYFSSKRYSWLMSNYIEMSWAVCDPENSESPIKQKIYFDAPLIGGGRLSDIPGLIDDLKISLILAVELSVFKGHSKLRSCSAMRHHVYYLKRVFNEIFDMIGCNWSCWDEEFGEKLAGRLMPGFKIEVHNLTGVEKGVS